MLPAYSYPQLHRLPRTGLMAAIGATPLLHLPRISEAFPDIEIYAKAEFLNPGGSVKDRAARAMILEGERTGQLAAGRTILDATSGNTGIAYAMIGAARGYRVKLCLPASASPERKSILRSYGVEVVLTDPGEGSDGAIRRCREIYLQNPDRYFYPDQYNNPANWKAHFESTGGEIIEQTQGLVTHFVAMLGTSGTFMGVSRRLRRDLPHVECWSVQPASPFHGIEGAKHMKTAIRPGIYDESLADGELEVETEDAHRMARRLAREEGLLVGVSAGANVHAACLLAQRLVADQRSGLLVTVLCDGGARYLNEEFWNDPD